MNFDPQSDNIVSCKNCGEYTGMPGSFCSRSCAEEYYDETRADFEEPETYDDEEGDFRPWSSGEEL